MTATRSLRRALTLQWVLFGGLLFAGFCAIGVLALYMLEDSFIDANLVRAAADEATAADAGANPRPEVWRLADFPESRRPALAALRPGALREFALDEVRYVHLRALEPDGEGPRFLVVEAQHEMRVNVALAHSAPWLAGLLAALLAASAWLARRFVARIERSVRALEEAIGPETRPATLRTAAERQPIAEFRRFGHALADALDDRLSALQREEETIRFLAHELRTPLQGARLASAALPGDSPAHRRLARAIARLDRASAAVLWLGEGTPEVAPVTVAPLALELVEELEPLAQQRRQAIEATVVAPLAWPLPAAAVEAVFGNLLLNAIQHGAPGPVTVEIRAREVVVTNRCGPEPTSRGHGVGLELSRRLLARIGWGLDAVRATEGFSVRLSPAGPSV